MPNFFGIDIAGLVNSSIAGAGGVRPGTLTKTVPGSRTVGDPTAGTNPTTTSHSFSGFAETREARRPGQVGASSMAVVTVLGASVSPAAVPEVNDTATIDGVVYVLVELLSGDPAGATFEFRARA